MNCLLWVRKLHLTKIMTSAQVTIRQSQLSPDNSPFFRVISPDDHARDNPASTISRGSQWGYPSAVRLQRN